MLTREDRDAIDGLFRRLSEAETRGGPRDAEAEALIRQKIAAQPAAPYYLAQTVVVQQEALKEAERRIEDLRAATGRSSVAVRGTGSRPMTSAGSRAMAYGGGGFLAGAAQTALGVAGGVMLGRPDRLDLFDGRRQCIGSPRDTSDDNAADGNDTGNDNFDGGDSGGSTMVVVSIWAATSSRPTQRFS